jgi:elongation factor Tu
VKVGEEVEIVGIARHAEDRPCTGVEMFRKLLDEGRPATTSALLLRGIEAARTSSAARCCAKPGSIKPHTKFEARGLRR